MSGNCIINGDARAIGTTSPAFVIDSYAAIFVPTAAKIHTVIAATVIRLLPVNRRANVSTPTTARNVSGTHACVR